MQKLTDLDNQIKRKRNLIAKHQKELSNLLSQCPHNNIIEKSQYVPGSYYDKAYTRYWNECIICHKKSEDTIDQHSSYG
jgi:hypothetical protein